MSNNETQAAKVDARLAEAREEGVEVHAGGDREGLYYQPTVIAGATPKMEIFREEVFGPVANIMFADNEDEAVELANDCDYGLSASVISASEERGLAVARRIESGMAHVNGTKIYDEPTIPFGGVKSSDPGRHGGRWSVETLTETRWLTVERVGRKNRSRSGFMDELTQDKLALRALIDNWAIWRDAGFRKKFRTVWHDDGRMMATRTQGAADEFIEMN
ncbi:MAG: aldehyde dehydrogenase family protein [Albidovulum sp.]|nr:aldehyde dehydrogenase family protein [Albidovulum sp.]